jgi:PPOX class probable FMN-dependent enzyme
MTFDHTLDLAGLEALYRQPSALVRSKKKPVLDELSIAFVRAAPFVLVGTCDASGRLDVSPRGGPAGFVQVLDDSRLAIGDLNGNNLLDSMRNIVDTGRIGLLLVHPGKDETLRVNGRACITTDPAVLDGFPTSLARPRTAIGVTIDEVFVHCAKAFRRGGVWDPASWAALGEQPDGASILACQFDIGADADQLRARLETGYAADLAADRADV